MEEVVIVIADFYLASVAEAASVRHVALPGLVHVARYGTGEFLDGGWRPWLATWAGQARLAREATATVASAASRATRSGEDRMAWLATPVHLVAGLSSVHLDERGLLHVEPTVRDALANEFNATFGSSGVHLEALPSAGFLMLMPGVGAPATVDPARLLGANITEALPPASEAPALRRLSAEIEMWLHEHEVNRERLRQGRLPISALWFWGGGAARESARGAADEDSRSMPLADTVPASTVRGVAMLSTSQPPAVAFGTDPYLHGLWCTMSASVLAPPESFDEVLACPGRRAVCVLELSRAFDTRRDWNARDALADLDQRWIERGIAALRRGDIARLTVVANDRKLSLGPRDRLKVWRMRRPALAALQ